MILKGNLALKIRFFDKNFLYQKVYLVERVMETRRNDGKQLNIDFFGQISKLNICLSSFDANVAKKFLHIRK